jgi:hypothetical protein
VYIFSKYEENILPEIQEGELLKIKKIEESEEFTAPALETIRRERSLKSWKS